MTSVVATSVRAVVAFVVLTQSYVQPQDADALSLNNFLMTAPKAYLAYSENVEVGVRLALKECRHQFMWERWDCPLEEIPVFTSSPNPEATREIAFMRAISSAGVTFTLTKNCSLGLVKNCACQEEGYAQAPSQTVPLKWKWGGCTQSYHFAEQASRVFVEGKGNGKDTRALIGRHNNEVGRQAVKRCMPMMCKCHGVSGSCTTKTCWKQLSGFRKVGDFVKKKFRRAVLADFHNGVPRDAISWAKAKGLGPRSGEAGGAAAGAGGVGGHPQADISVIAVVPGQVRPTSLIYLDPSPDYCMENATVYRTLGRQCMRTKRGRHASLEEKRSCSTLCRDCGLRVRRTLVPVQTSCDCKFHWCCTVKCRTCVEEQTIFECALK